MERDDVSELLPPTGVLFISKVIQNMENHGRVIPKGEKSCFVLHRALWQSCQQSYLVANQEELGEEVYEFSLAFV
jgi:GR25 family glycosyltransferase involved in LPS biosynthesis